MSKRSSKREADDSDEDIDNSHNHNGGRANDEVDTDSKEDAAAAAVREEELMQRLNNFIADNRQEDDDERQNERLVRVAEAERQFRARATRELARASAVCRASSESILSGKWKRRSKLQRKKDNIFYPLVDLKRNERPDIPKPREPRHLKLFRRDRRKKWRGYLARKAERERRARNRVPRDLRLRKFVAGVKAFEGDNLHHSLVKELLQMMPGAQGWWMAHKPNSRTRAITRAIKRDTVAEKSHKPAYKRKKRDDPKIKSLVDTLDREHQATPLASRRQIALELNTTHQIKVSASTVQKIRCGPVSDNGLGAKPRRRIGVQKMNPAKHYPARVESAKRLLRSYGYGTEPNSPWLYVINTVTLYHILYYTVCDGVSDLGFFGQIPHGA